MSIVIHADDYGITVEQACALLALSSACGGEGALASVSMFANSPAFEEAAALAKPFVASGALQSRPHLNVVEGFPCAAAADVPLLVNGRGAFSHAFGSLFVASMRGGKTREKLRRQLAREFTTQIERYLAVFPEQREHLALDSHQHVHLIPVVFDALLEAVERTGCTLTSLRIPVEAVGPHFASAHRVRAIPPLNLVKDALLATLAVRARRRMPKGCTANGFCGIVLSGRMDRATPDLLAELETREAARGRNLEALYHPVRVPIEACFDPENAPFATACANEGRDRETAAMRALRDG